MGEGFLGFGAGLLLLLMAGGHGLGVVVSKGVGCDGREIEMVRFGMQGESALHMHVFARASNGHSLYAPRCGSWRHYRGLERGDGMPSKDMNGMQHQQQESGGGKQERQNAREVVPER